MAVVLTNAGEEWACQRMAGSGTDSAKTGQYVGWGTGAGTAAKSDTTLFTETGTRASGTVSVSGTGSAAKYQVIGTLTASGTLAITNGANFCDSSGGTMIVKGDHGTVNLSSGDAIQYTITLDPQ